MSSSTLVFLDTETTSLNRWTRRPWEIALIVRERGNEDVEYCWQVDDIDLSDADPMSLKIGKFFQRHEGFAPNGGPFDGSVMTESVIARQVERLTRGATLVGAVPDFDEQTLAAMLRRHNLCPAWHYHLVDVETLAAGALKLAPPWNFDKVLELFDLKYDERDRHTALGDTRMVRDLYDAVLTS